MKTIDELNQGFRIKNKHRFYDTVSYHNYGAYLVGVTGFEPAASCSQSKRATNCATSRDKCKMQNAKCKMQNAECKIKKAEIKCKVQDCDSILL